ncbi:hypothetical protein AVEN_201318-1 [Araneus ventricosus]|uniref:Uncharacterized protein n=1 Tax=Araneus ventricosus TaxID=182803 RepID=A0A4Y2KIA4_ARAVE|nr:hypothetical protein AVEN_201318-1 [Araneus ventricosus]
MTSFLKAQRPPEAPKALGPQLQQLQPHVQPITKEIQIITENDSSDRRQNLITPNSCSKTRWRRNNPVENFDLKINKVETLMDTTTKVKTNNN